MGFHKIEVDDAVWDFLKKHAEPFEDTPNSVLGRVLFGRDKKNEHLDVTPNIKSNGPNLPVGVPNALSQVLEVIYQIRTTGCNRIEATKIVAKRRGTFPQTVIDKYCRQLDKKAYEIDQLLHEQTLVGFKSLLESKFVNHKEVIESFFYSLPKEPSSTSDAHPADQHPGIPRDRTESNPHGPNNAKRKGEMSTISDTYRKARNSQREAGLKMLLGALIKDKLKEGFVQKGDSQLTFPNSGEKFLCKYSSFKEDQYRWFWGVSRKYWASWDSQDHLALIMENEDRQGFSYLLLDSQESSELFKRCSESNGEKQINMRIYLKGGGTRLQEWQELDIKDRIKPLPGKR